MSGRALPWVPDDGGREAAGFLGDAGDCVVRAIAIAGARDYRDVYDELTAATHVWRDRSRSREARAWRESRRAATPRAGVPTAVVRAYLGETLGWQWTPTMAIGTGTTTHLAVGELPAGRLVVRASGHLCAVIDGRVHDTHDPCRGGRRAVYGYWVVGSVPAVPLATI